MNKLIESIGNNPKIIMTFREVTEDLYYEIVLVDIMCKCEECFKETRLLYKLNLEYGVYTCPICMLKHKTI